VLTIAGIVLGVAVFVGMHTANQSVVHAFYQTIDRIAGATQLQITAGEPGFSEDILEKVQSIPDVRVAVPVIEAVVNPSFANAGSLLILAVDMTGDRSLRNYDFESGDESVVDDPLIFLAQSDSLIIASNFAQEHGLHIDSKIDLDTMDGRKKFTVRGIMKPGGLTSAFGGSLAVMDVYAAQKVFGRGRRFDRIDLAVRDGARVDDVQKQLQQKLGAGYQVEPPSARGEQFENLSQIYAMTANITSLFALFIGMFIIFNTFSIAVTQRRTEIGILRALGATGQQIRTLFLTESVVLGLIGTAAGIGFGVLIARGMAGQVGSFLGEIYGVAQKAEGITTNPRLLGLALLIGVCTSVIAAWIPARNAARVDPVQALQKGKHQILSEGENRIRRILAIVIAALAVACLVGGLHNRALFYVGYMLTVVAALLITPTACILIAKALRPVIRALRPVEGTLAVDSLIQAPRRTSGAVAALMLSLALVITLAGMAKASYTNIRTWLDVALNPDLVVTGSEKLTRRDFLFPAEMYGELERVPGVAEVQAVRSGRIMVGGRPVMLVTADIRKISRRSKLPAISGEPEEMYRKTAAGQGVIISDNLSLLRGYKYGDMLDIPAPNGVLRMPIVGVVLDYSDQQGTVLVDHSVYLTYWGDDRFNIFRVYVKDKPAEEQVRQAILNRFVNQRRLFVLTNQELRSYILNLTDQWFGITYLQIAVAVLVAILGIVNTLTVSITDRRRELGVLQAVGGLRRQIRGTIWIEALTIAVIGVALGFTLGAAQLFYSLEIARRDLAGIRLSYEYPVGIALAILPTMLIAAFFAAVGPAESAVRGSLVEALEYE
jgi:putative ABC transport system permease protein